MLISAGTGILGCLILEFPLRGWLERRAHRLYDTEVRKNQRKLESGQLPSIFFTVFIITKISQKSLKSRI